MAYFRCIPKKSKKIYTWGEPATSLVDGGKYAITMGTPGSVIWGDEWNVLGSDDVGQKTTHTDEPAGEIAKNLIWTVNVKSNGYVFSTTIDGVTYYLNAAKTMVNSGQKLTLTKTATPSTGVFVANTPWTVTQAPDDNTKYYVTIKKSSSTYYLRHYGSSAGWCASSKSNYIKFYEVNE